MVRNVEDEGKAEPTLIRVLELEGARRIYARRFPDVNGMEYVGQNDFTKVIASVRTVWGVLRLQTRMELRTWGR